MEIAIVNYDDNITALITAFKKLGANCDLTNNVFKWKYADAIILPDTVSLEKINRVLGSNVTALRTILSEITNPILGIGVGMHFLTQGDKSALECGGLGIVGGYAKSFQTAPHRQWCEVKVRHSSLFDGLERFSAYFDHTHYCQLKDKGIISAISRYEISFPAAFSKKNIFAIQFCPEKSNDDGFSVLENFLRLVKK